ncbi:MAG: glycosyltransferase, partial [Verrucomicrobiota bacterium]
MKLDQITPVILTSNEEPNISRTLSALSWAETIIMLDSFSTDRTKSICREFRNVRFHQRKFTTHSEQWNAAINLATTPWVLSLDADYQLSSNLLHEMKELTPSLSVKGYAIPFIFAVNGSHLRAHLLPPRIA